MGPIGLVSRAARLWHDLESTVADARTLADRAGQVVVRIERDLDDVEALIRRADRTVDTVGAVVDSAAGVLTDAAALTDVADEVVSRLQRLQQLYEPPLRALAPVLTETATRLRPEHAGSLGRLLDLVPRVLDQIEPALRNLAHLAPELEQVTERVDNVGEIVEGLPGAKLLQRRGKAKESDPAED